MKNKVKLTWNSEISEKVKTIEDVIKYLSHYAETIIDNGDEVVIKINTDDDE